jgi:hypothetical protein
MDELLAALRTGAAPGSTATEREAAAAVCRAFLIALETEPGQPLSPFAKTPPPHVIDVTEEPPPPSSTAASALSVESLDATTDELSEEEGLVEGEEEPTDDDTEENPATCPEEEEDGVSPHDTEAPSSSPQPPSSSPSMPPQIPNTPLDPRAVATLFQAARSLPTEQLLELAIMHMRTQLKAKGADAPASRPGVRFNLVQIPPDVRAIENSTLSSLYRRSDER